MPTGRSSPRESSRIGVRIAGAAGNSLGNAAARSATSSNRTGPIYPGATEYARAPALRFTLLIDPFRAVVIGLAGGPDAVHGGADSGGFGSGHSLAGVAAITGVGHDRGLAGPE